MKVVRLLPLALVTSTLCFGANKEMLQLQRDVALLQDQVRTLQRTLDEKVSALNVLLQQTQDSSQKTNGQITNLQDMIGKTVNQQLQPLSTVSSKVDSMGEDVRGVKESMADLNGRLDRLDAKITDLTNKINLAGNPPPAPGSNPTGPPQAGNMQPSGPPAGMSADKAYSDAERDRQTGNLDLALKEYQDYLTYFPNTDLAPSAQYYVGQIYYNRGDNDNAIKAFDAVLERYPENAKTADAHYMKATALLKAGQRNQAVQEFRDLIDRYPRTELSRKAQAQLRGLGVSAGVNSMPARRKPRQQ